MVSDDFERDIWCLLGIPLDATDMSGAVRAVTTAAAERRPCFLSTPNVNFLIGCQSDAEFRQSVINSELSVADGMPLIWIAKLLGIPLAERVSGSGLIEVLRDRPIDRDPPLSVYFFGGEEGVAQKACSKLKEAQSGLCCAGYFNPGFGSVEDMSSEEIIGAINDSRADFVIVSLGAKKGQAWIQRNRGRLNAPVISHLGAVVNFVAGTVNRSPRWMQRLGIEWLWRIKEEPALWRRYWSDGIALGRLILTRVLPYAVWCRLSRPSAAAMRDRPSVALTGQGEVCRIVLSGALIRDNLQEMRRVFRLAAAQVQDVTLDFEAVHYVDTAFLGLLLMLQKHVTNRGKKLYVTSPSNKVIKIFRWNALGYLLN